jgi:hypothetical protein
MKKILLTIILFLAVNNVFSQVFVGGININNLDQVKYCELLGVNMLGQAKIDYGQHRKILSVGSNITDDKGKAIQFNSNIAVLNYMAQRGWKLIDFDIVSKQEQYFLFEKQSLKNYNR